jgi:hypothetical protein
MPPLHQHQPPLSTLSRAKLASRSRTPGRDPAPEPERITLDALATGLDEMLAGLLEAYESCARAVTEHRDAIRRADSPAMQRAAARQSTALSRIAELEQSRRDLVASAEASGHWQSVAGNAQIITLSGLVDRLPEPRRTPLAERAHALKIVMRAVHTQQRTLGAAVQSLAAHIEGVMREVARTLSHAGTYGRRGIVDANAAVVTALDIRS